MRNRHAEKFAIAILILVALALIFYGVSAAPSAPHFPATPISFHHHATSTPHPTFTATHKPSPTPTLFPCYMPTCPPGGLCAQVCRSYPTKTPIGYHTPTATPHKR